MAIAGEKITEWYLLLCSVPLILRMMKRVLYWSELNQFLRSITESATKPSIPKHAEIEWLRVMKAVMLSAFSVLYIVFMRLLSSQGESLASRIDVSESLTWRVHP